MKDRLFTIVNGEPIVEAPLVNLGPFKKLWREDRTDDKSTYKKWMLFIYYMCDYRSDFFELDSDVKQKEALKEVFQRTNYPIPHKVELCMEEYRKRNTPSEQRALESAIVSADNINKQLGELQQNSAQLEKLITLIEKQIDAHMKNDEIEQAMIKMEQKMDLQKRQMDLLKLGADLIPRVEKAVESIISLRNKVEKAMKKIQESKELTENFIVDEFISKKEKGDYTND